jgi:TnpA family transposase
VLLPGLSTLERFVGRVRNRVETRIWRLLVPKSQEHKEALDQLLNVTEGSRASLLDQLRSGPIRASCPALVGAIKRLERIRNLSETLTTTTHVPQSRITSLARFAQKSKVTAVARLPEQKRLATLTAFVHCLEAAAHDDALEVLEIVLDDIFGKAEREDKKIRFRSLKDLDQSAMILADACKVILDEKTPGEAVRDRIFEVISANKIALAVNKVQEIVRPPNNVYFQELEKRYRRIRVFLPTLLKHLHFGSNHVGKPVTIALQWLKAHEINETHVKAPLEAVGESWRSNVIKSNGAIDNRAYTLCILEGLRIGLKRRNIFVEKSLCYADPRAGLLADPEWKTTKPIICRTLELSTQPEPVLASLTAELEHAYQTTIHNFPNNHALRFEHVSGKERLILSPLDRLEETPSLISLRQAVLARLPQVELPEILLEIASRTGFTESFTHIAEHETRASDLAISICAVLLAEACNTGLEPFVRNDVPALRRQRLLWVDQNYIRDETIALANANLVSAQAKIELAQAWGGGEVASADGMRFVVPVQTIHAGANPKYFGWGRGVTWYNMLSDQFTGLNAITVPGTLRDSLVILGIVLEQQTDLTPTYIMTDTGAYSDIVFGLFRLLGYRFSPRLADIGGTRFGRINQNADYGHFNDMSRHKINMQLIAENWDDMLRLAASLKLGRVQANGIMRTLQVADRPTQLARAIAEFGRIDKTIHALTFINDKDKRRAILTQLNRSEGRHRLAREVFHGKRGELRQRYRVGQEDQLGALGLVVNVIALWNTLYMDASITQLKKEGFAVNENDVPRLSPLGSDHINMLGRYSFAVPEAVTRGELRPLRNPFESTAIK